VLVVRDRFGRNESVYKISSKSPHDFYPLALFVLFGTKNKKLS